ncbi:hypothetical protein WJX79_001199 [Trebouxia sp. C0005]
MGWDLQLVVSEQDVSGRYLAVTPTLFYMPHCDCHLYNNLLQANWGPHQLHKIAILGNSFHSYVQRWAHRSKKDNADRPHELLAMNAEPYSGVPCGTLLIHMVIVKNASFN